MKNFLKDLKEEQLKKLLKENLEIQKFIACFVLDICISLDDQYMYDELLDQINDGALDECYILDDNFSTAYINGKTFISCLSL